MKHVSLVESLGRNPTCMPEQGESFILRVSNGRKRNVLHWTYPANTSAPRYMVFALRSSDPVVKEDHKGKVHPCAALLVVKDQL